MAETLKFSQNADKRWEASVTTTGDRIAVALDRESSGPLIVYGSIDGMKKSILHDFGPGTPETFIFEIDIPGDVEITVVSYSEVLSAKYTGI